MGKLVKYNAVKSGESVSFKVIMVFVACVLVSACSGPTIDASSEAALKESTQNILESLEPAKKIEFQSALARVTIREALRGGLDLDKARQAEERIKQLLDGKSAEEVIELAAGK